MEEIEGRRYLDAQEAATFLGVKLATLYAYASRGSVTSYRQGIKRRRLYLLEELERLTNLGASKAPRPSRLPLAADWIPYTS